MQTKLSRKNLLQKTAQIASSTLLSRLLGLVREVLQIRYLGFGAIPDAFVTAFKIPNTLRKVFAEGALSAAFIPTFVSMLKKGEDKRQINKLITLTFVAFQISLFLFCFLIFCKTEFVLSILVPGFHGERLAYAVQLTRVLIFFILFISSSALFGGALNAVGHFFVPAFGQVVINVVYIGGLLLCLFFKLPIYYLAYFILLAGFTQLIMHLIAYLKYDLSFERPDEKTWHYFKQAVFKFLPVLFSTSIIEINLWIDQAFASYMKVGDVSLLSYSWGFTRIALGVFAVAFSTTLLPYFTRIASYAPKRLSYYLLESTKFVLWVTLPVTIFMMSFSYKIFYTIFHCKDFCLDAVIRAQYIMIAFLIGLFFFSLNKILLNIYYGLHETFIPTLISAGGTCVNTLLNFVLIKHLQTYGLALATSLAAILQTIVFIYVLHKYYKFNLYINDFILFLMRLLLQMLFICTVFATIYFGIYYLIDFLVTNNLLIKLPIIDLVMNLNPRDFLINGLGLWMWVSPLAVFMFLLMYRTRKLFKLKIYFLN
ncbi:murein biosynthesis integral membrane protein MurJ [Candidatus Dependentiae bacterium]|nr:murein biosynthesis integral membrane protein MurJ [Candidatus Dependentiae bacterium]